MIGSTYVETIRGVTRVDRLSAASSRIAGSTYVETVTVWRLSPRALPRSVYLIVPSPSWGPVLSLSHRARSPPAKTEQRAGAGVILQEDSPSPAIAKLVQILGWDLDDFHFYPSLPQHLHRSGSGLLTGAVSMRKDQNPRPLRDSGGYGWG